MKSDLSILLKNLNLAVTNEHQIQCAFVHRSYLNESKEYKESNERLEYLGDAVLELATSEFLYKKYPKYQEGMLTNLRAALVRTESLASAAQTIGFPDYLLMSKGEESGGGRSNVSLLANTFEAFLGALYLDQGFAVCEKFLHTHLFVNVEQIVHQGSYKDYKSLVQEISQSMFKSTPKYELQSEEGPDHNKIFRMKVIIGEKEYATGEGKSKQSAQEDAAKKTLEMINIS